MAGGVSIYLTLFVSFSLTNKDSPCQLVASHRRAFTVTCVTVYLLEMKLVECLDLSVNKSILVYTAEQCVSFFSHLWSFSVVKILLYQTVCSPSILRLLSFSAGDSLLSLKYVLHWCVWKVYLIIHCINNVKQSYCIHFVYSTKYHVQYSVMASRWVLSKGCQWLICEA